MRAMEKQRLLASSLAEFDSDDTSIVIFGSLARGEFTPGSDVDWTLLIDGIADPGHVKTALEIERKLSKMGFKEPGRERTFASLAFSHELIHLIGGEDDSNANTTRRILLLLESQPVCRREAYDRVVKNVLKRYLREDRGIWYGSSPYKIPRFLLNDIARYWRTMAVDFAYKQRSRGNKGFAIRTLKLRMSRKVIFLSGLLASFSCHVDFCDDAEREAFYAAPGKLEELVHRMEEKFKATPLETIAAALLPYADSNSAVRVLFDAYDEFVGMLADDARDADNKTKRDHLEEIAFEELENDRVFQKGRGISHRFQDAIRAIFLTSDNELGRLTIEYGVF